MSDSTKLEKWPHSGSSYPSVTLALVSECRMWGIGWAPNKSLQPTRARSFQFKVMKRYGLARAAELMR